jgi:VIT1/CCC1 family predicted Fe2+/Mn2+ transporter
MRHKHIPTGPDNFLSFLEGIQGGFAIFTGIIAGLSFQVQSRKLLVITGLISVIVSAFNSSAIRYSTQHYVDELDGHEKRHKFKSYTVPAVIEFIVYLLVSFIVLLPLILIDSIPIAIILCAFITVSVLFVAGYYRGWLLRTHPVKDGFELAFLGAAIIFIGTLSGYIVKLLI